MRKLVLGMALATTALASPALARDDSWYIEADAGAMIVEDSLFDVGTTVGAMTVNHDYGYDMGGIIGYDFGGFRLEAEASYREADPDNLTSTVRIPAAGSVASTASGIGSYNYVAGDVNALSFMVNGMLDFGEDDGLQGFVGGGAGVARVDHHYSINRNGPGVVRRFGHRLCLAGDRGRSRSAQRQLGRWPEVSLLQRRQRRSGRYRWPCAQHPLPFALAARHADLQLRWSTGAGCRAAAAAAAVCCAAAAAGCRSRRRRRRATRARTSCSSTGISRTSRLKLPAILDSAVTAYAQLRAACRSCWPVMPTVRVARVQPGSLGASQRVGPRLPDLAWHLGWRDHQPGLR